ncbi:MAG: DEAD/DEAH box helicase family protein, partial [Acidobacteria bacterium]|nr:DEAD/DEAH box helicase family protein [Acidobacteriota bacterium]
MTRRVMSERLFKAAVSRPSRPGAGGDLPPSETPRVPPTSPWRLVPEGVALHAWQKECLPLWLASGRGTVKVATGGGKTLFALAAAQELQNQREPDLRLVIVVPTIPLMFQWEDEVRSGNLFESAIGLMGGGREPPPEEGLRILLCVLNSARDRLPAFVEKAGWGPRMLLVVDECHHASAEQARRIFETRPRYTLGLS